MEIKLSEKDFQRVVDAIENPPKPNKALIDAFQKHQIYKDKIKKLEEYAKEKRDEEDPLVQSLVIQTKALILEIEEDIRKLDEET